MTDVAADNAPPAHNKEVGATPGQAGDNGAPVAPQMSAEEHDIARAAARFGYGPLAHVPTSEARLPPFGGEFQPGLYKPVEGRKFGNPAPLGLCAFALTTFVLSAINMGAQDLTKPNIVVALAFGYGGLVQLLAGMWYVWILVGPWSRPLINCPGKWLLATPLVLPPCPRTVDSGSPSQSS